MLKRSILVSLCILVLGPAFSAWAGLDPTLAGWWSFDEGAGTVAHDGSGNGNDGTLAGDAAWVAGYLDGALQFNGSNAQVVAPHIALDNQSFTIAMWINPVLTGSAIIFSQQDASSANLNLHIRLGGPSSTDVAVRAVLFGFYSNDLATPADLIEDNTWYHLAFTYDYENQDRRIYIDGEQVAQATATPFLGAKGDTIIGSWTSNQYFNGILDDVQLYHRALADGEITKIMRGLTDQSLAQNLSPAVAATDVPRDVVLSWEAGQFAGTHDIYLGTSFEDVNDADRTNPMGVLLSQGQTDTMLDSGRLEFGQTYYWRVDEVNAVGNAIFQSDIWSFTVEPLAYPIENIVVTSNAVSDEGTGPEKTVDGSGLNELDQHSIEATDMWLCSTGDEPVYLQYEFDGVYKLHEMQVWNYNVQFELMLGFGIKDVTVEYSENGTDWTVLEEAVFAQATATADYAANTVVDFGGVAVKYVKLTINSGYGLLPQYGLGEVRFLYVPVLASEPQPADGAADVSVTSVFNWRSGREAASHEVYVGTDPNALTLAGTVDAASFDPGALALETSYYWQISEVNEAEAISAWTGSVWSFSTQAYIVVEGFESYNDEDNRIYETWADGWVNDTGSTVGYFESPFAETTIVKSGNQAMPLFYDNSGTAVSEADLALSQNWTTNGIKSFSLYFHGAAGNTGQLYVKINNTKVAYDGDAADIARDMWQPWNIDLSSVGGNLSNVTSLTIGIEGAGASGVLYVDDIRLYPKTPEYITPVQLDDAGLVALYNFDGNADDSSGNGNHGTLNGDPQFVAGHDGSALDCDGTDDFVSTGKTASDLGIAGNGPRTVMCWVYTRGFANGGIYDVGARATGADFCLRTLSSVENRWRVQYWGGDYDFSFDTANKWVHFAHVHDGTRTQVYANGILVVDWEKTIDTTDENPFQIGCYGWQNDYFDGLIDDVRLYNRALSGGEVLGFLGETMPRHKPF